MNIKQLCLALCLATVPLTPSMARAEAVTQACLGDLDKLLICEKPNELVDQRKSDGGATYCASSNGFDSWPPSSRNGPSIWYRNKSNNTIVRRAGLYKAHKKIGRHFYFDKQGRLEAITDFKADKYQGIDVRCYDNGAVESVTPYTDAKIHGIARRWTREGQPKSMTRYENHKRIGRIEDPSLEQAPPAGLCQPRVCDLYTPIGSGI